MLKWNVFFSGLMLISLYYFLFPREMEGELSIVPDSLVAVEQTFGPVPVQNIIASMKNDGRVFFVDKNRKVFSMPANESSALASEWFAELKNGRSAVVYPDGRPRVRISEKGRPIAANNNLFVYREDLGRLSMLNPESGRRLWRREFLSPLTDLDFSGGQTLACFLDGGAVLFNEEGNPLALYQSQESRVEAVYGGTISDDGKIALVSGLDPQRIQILQHEDGNFETIFEKKMEEERRKNATLGFVDNGAFLLYEDAGKIVRVNVKDASVEVLNIPGELSGWFEDTAQKRLNFFGRTGSRKFLRSFSLHGEEHWDAFMPLRVRKVEQVGRYILLITDKTIAFLRVEII